MAAIRNRQALADELRARVYALARLAPALDKPRFRARKFLPPSPGAHRADRAA
jgi:hypothetical protein